MMRFFLFLTVGSMIVLGLSSCSSPLDRPFLDEGWVANTWARSSLDVVSWQPDLSLAQRYVPVHANDGGVGGTELEIDGTTMAPRFGVGGALGCSFLRLYAGADLRFNPSSSSDDDLDDFDDDHSLEYRSGYLRDFERQPLSWNYNSYGYGWMEVSDYTSIPFLGVETELGNVILFGVEAGVPRTGFRYERGHWRNGNVDVLEHGKWTGYGQSYSAKLGARLLDNRAFLGLQYSFEHYDADFSGVDTDIDANIIGLLFELRF